MTTDLVSIKGGTVTDTTMVLPDNLSEKRWAEIGEELGRAERAVGWWIGDWWNSGEKHKHRVDIVQAETWKGPTIATCRSYGSVAARFDPLSRLHTLPFEHHRAVASLPPEQARTLLDHAVEVQRQTSKAPPVRLMRQHVKSIRREARETELAADIERASATLGSKLYGVIMADPPWRFEPYSRETGMDRAAENHYPTMTVEELCEMTVPAAEDCALFLWATTPMLLEALDVMDAWGFEYHTHWVWVKPRPGTGYWNRSCHELLLLGTKGSVPAPAPGTQMDSVFQGEVGDHSVKPAAAAELVEEMFPSAACLEMFARGPRLGWDVWGAESGGEQKAPDSGSPLFADEAAAALDEVRATDGRAA
jgi:N6-adenosine-specific RNA methylase IME4